MKKQLLLASILTLPGLAFAQYPQVSVFDVQNVSAAALGNCADSSFYKGDTVIVTGVVVVDGGLAQVAGGHNVWIQDSLGAYRGLDVYGGPSSNYNNINQPLNQLVAGMEVQITGWVDEYLGETELIPVAGNTVTILSSGNTVSSQVVSIADLNDANKNNNLVTGEQWEGAFIELQNVTVTAVTYFSSGTRVSFDVVDGAGNKINVSDRFLAGRLPAMGGTFAPPNVGDTYSSLKGIVMHSKNNCSGFSGRGYELHPFSASHYVLASASPNIINVQRNLITPTSSQNVTVTADITDADGTITSATLFYAIGASSFSFTAVPMTNTGGNIYSASIPAQADGSFVKYYISATDNNNNTTIVPNTTITNGTYFYTVRNTGTTIYDLQYTPFSNGNSGYKDMTVTVTGVVTASSKPNDLGYVYIQQENQLGWAGIMATGNQSLSTLNRGEKVTITGVVEENFGYTRLKDVSAITQAGTGSITPITLDPAVFTTYGFATNEQYEGMLVQLADPNGGRVHIVDENADATGATPNFGEYRVGTDNFDPNTGTRVLAGRQSSSAYSSLDVSLVNSANWSSTDGTMNVPVVLVDDSMSMDTLRGIMYYSFSNFKILPRNNSDIIGLNATLPGVGISEVNKGTVRMYPNPVSSILNIETEIAGIYTIVVTDVTGREMMRTVSGGNFISVDTAPLASGYYVVSVVNAKGEIQHTEKLIRK